MPLFIVDGKRWPAFRLAPRCNGTGPDISDCYADLSVSYFPGAAADLGSVWFVPGGGVQAETIGTSATRSPTEADWETDTMTSSGGEKRRELFAKDEIERSLIVRLAHVVEIHAERIALRDGSAP